jgi:hypothetical protein
LSKPDVCNKIGKYRAGASPGGVADAGGVRQDKASRMKGGFLSRL